jgi:hypothetical protein
MNAVMVKDGDQVILDRAPSYSEHAGDFSVGMASGRELGDFELAGGQAARR